MQIVIALLVVIVAILLLATGLWVVPLAILGAIVGLILAPFIWLLSLFG